MRFLANENFPGAAIAALDAAGHEVLSVRLVAPGASDANVLEWAVREQRILLTFDKDFGELARASGVPATCGIVLFACQCPSRETSVSGSRDYSGRAEIGPAISR
jgi:predicted nuclease of predicted toxin-antitoxin system